MLDIEIIKWGCGFAEGFRIDSENQFGFIANNLVWDSFPISFLNKSPMFESLYYPLFLQRVIEGVNELEYKDKGVYEIIAFTSVIRVYKNHVDTKNFYLQDFNTIDQAKEQAIKYIYDQK